MNVIKLALEDPRLVGVINYEGHVWRDTKLNLATIVTGTWVVKAPNNVGWIGLRSVPMTTAEGCLSAEESFSVLDTCCD